MSSERFPALRHFFGAYFHQDWPEEFQAWSDAVDHFIADESADVVNATKLELQCLIDESLSETELERRLFSLLCNYYAPAEGQTFSRWLNCVCDKLS
jgi:hypothetical protein